MPISEVYNCDCIDYMAKCSDKQFDLAIVDPPYGINVGKMPYTQEENRPCRQKNGNIISVKKTKYKIEDWDNKPPEQNYFNELIRISKNQIIWGIEYYSLNGIGDGRIIWDKGVPEGLSFNRYEKAYCSLITGNDLLQLLWTGFSQAKSISEPMVQQGNKKLNEKRIHPCHKPIMLYKLLLNNYGKKGDKIFDSHLGSQSSRIAAYDMGFDFYGCELNLNYYNSACKRFEQFKSQLKLF